MSELKLSYSGYVCAPYLHNRDSLELKESWSSSKNIEKLYFVTGTFSSDSQPYFSTSANHYLLAKFKDSSIVEKELSKHVQEKTSFVFNIHDDLFEREVLGDTNFISIYYLEYGEDMEITETPKAKVGEIVVEIWPYELVIARVRTTRNDSFISGTEFAIELKLDENGNYVDYL